MKVDEDDSYTGKDTIVVSMEGLRGRKEKTRPGQHGGPDLLDWQLYDLFDPQDITASSAIKVTIARQGQPQQERTSVFRLGRRSEAAQVRGRLEVPPEHVVPLIPDLQLRHRGQQALGVRGVL